MSNILSNSWVQSIVAGIIVSGIFELINYLKEEKDYIKRVKNANEEFYTLILGILAENKVPEISILKRSLKGIAVKHTVKYSDISNVDHIFNLIVKETMQSNFLTYETKLELCNKLDVIVLLYDKEDDVKISDDDIYYKYTFYRNRRFRFLFLTGAISSISIIIAWLRNNNFNLIRLVNGDLKIEDMVVITGISLIILTFFVTVIRDKWSTDKKIKEHITTKEKSYEE